MKFRWNTNAVAVTYLPSVAITYEKSESPECHSSEAVPSAGRTSLCEPCPHYPLVGFTARRVLRVGWTPPSAT